MQWFHEKQIRIRRQVSPYHSMCKDQFKPFVMPFTRHVGNILRARLPVRLVSCRRRLIGRHARIADDAKRASRQPRHEPIWKNNPPDQTSVTSSSTVLTIKAAWEKSRIAVQRLPLPSLRSITPSTAHWSLVILYLDEPVLSRQCCDLGCGSLVSLIILPQHNDFLPKQLLPLYNHSETVY